MICDCHIHMVLDGKDWKTAIGSHRDAPREDIIRRRLARYRERGFSYLRDGGDRWGVGLRARALAEEYDIVYRTPLSPLYALGHYGGFIGTGFASLAEYAELVRKQRALGADFIKVMISGLMDFDRFGVLTQEGLPAETIRELVSIAHAEGLSVMAHCNGAHTAQAAAEAGTDSIEHGAYLDQEALAAMLEAGTVWVPTLSAIGCLRHTGRFSEPDVEKILESAMENLRCFSGMGGLIAPGTDAGAWAVPHGSLSEYALLKECLGADCDDILLRGSRVLQQKF